MMVKWLIGLGFFAFAAAEAKGVLPRFCDCEYFQGMAQTELKAWQRRLAMPELLLSLAAFASVLADALPQGKGLAGAACLILGLTGCVWGILLRQALIRPRGGTP